MTSPACGPLRLALGAYVLGALEPADRADVETHLAGCAECRAELAEFAGLPGLLGRIDLADAVAPPAAPPEMLDRLLVAARQDRRSAKRWRVAVAAAAVVVASGAAAGVTAHFTADGSRHHAAVWSATGVHGIQAQVEADPRGWGTALTVRLHDAPHGETCSLVAVSTTGSHDVAATWHVGYDSGYVDVGGATSIPLSDIAAYEVVTADGQQLVRVTA